MRRPLALAILSRASYAAANADTSAGWIGVQKQSADKSRKPHMSCGFFIHGPFNGGPDVGAQARRFLRRRLPGTPTHLGCRPDWRRSGSFKTATSEAIMTHLSIGTFAIREFDGLYSLNDLHQAAGGETRHRPIEFLRIEPTKALIGELVKGGPDHLFLKTTKGRNGGTYACRELVIAYAAWISPAFHLKVIRVFLDAVSPQEPQQALPLTIDPAALMLEGGSTPTVAMPPEVEKALRDRKWEMLREADTAIEEHLRRRITRNAECGNPRVVDINLAMRALEGHTLGDALTHTYRTKLDHLIKDTAMFSRMAADLADAMRGARGPLVEATRDAIGAHRISP